MIDVKDKEERMDRLVDATYSSKIFPGMAIGVIQSGKLCYFRGLGRATLSDDAPVTEDTVFRLASISKTFTATGILQQWERGTIHLDEPVNQHLDEPWIRVKQGWPEMTIRHLLTHRSGIGELARCSDAFKRGFGMLVVGRGKPIPPLASIHQKPLVPNVAPGTKYAYSNFGYSLLGYVLEQLHGGTDFRDIMVDTILDPLGMAHSDFIPSSRVSSLEATGYKSIFGRFKPATYYQNITKPAGNLYSSTRDMARFAGTLLARGKHDNDNSRLLNPETIEKAWTPQWWAHDSLKDRLSVGLGFQIMHVNGFKVVGHTGATSGFTSAMALIPAENIAILVFSNLDEIFVRRGTIVLKNDILSLLCGKGEPDFTRTPGEPSFKREAEGYYGPLPGFLTNTRMHMYHGSDIKVTSKPDHLEISSLFASWRKGKRLEPTTDPLVFDIVLSEKEPAKKEMVAFFKDEQEKITGLAFGLQVLRKNRFFNTFRFKFYLLIVAGMIAGIVIVVLSSLKSM